MIRHTHTVGNTERGAYITVCRGCIYLCVTRDAMLLTSCCAQYTVCISLSDTYCICIPYIAHQLLCVAEYDSRRVIATLYAPSL
jgi:hypothetical protein